MSKEGIAKECVQLQPSLDLRYVGQYHEVPLPVSMDDIASFNLERIQSEFHKEHNRQFGYSLEQEGTELEIINLRLRAIGVIEKPNLPAEIDSSTPVRNPNTALKGRRRAYVPEIDELKEVPVYDGDKLTERYTIEGPAIIEQVNTTIFLGNSYDCGSGIGGSFIVYNRDKYPEGFRLEPTKRGCNGRY
jgi:N-methylhydantoinase A